MIKRFIFTFNCRKSILSKKQLQTLKFHKWKIIIHFRFYPEKRRKIDKFMLKSIRKIVYVFFTYFKYYAIISI